MVDENGPVPVLEHVHIGESSDFIIGVNGSRVRNLREFEDQLRDLQPGEIVYLNIVRNGERVPVRVQLPTMSAG